MVTDDGEERKLEFVKRFEPIRGKKVVYMILTVDEEVFTSNLLVGKESEMLKSCLMTRQGDVLTADGLDECAPAVQTELQGLEKGTEKFETQGRSWYCIRIHRKYQICRSQPMRIIHIWRGRPEN